MLKDFHFDLGPALIYYDNTSTIKIAENLVFHERMKHIEIDCHLVHQQLQCNLVHLLPVSSQLQLADCLTKALSPASFQLAIAKMGIQNLYTPS